MAHVSIDLVFDDSEILAKDAIEIYFKVQELEPETNYVKTKDGKIYVATKYEGDSITELPYTQIQLWNPEIIEI